MKERKRRCAKRRARDVERRNWKLRKIDSGPETLFMARGPCALPTSARIVSAREFSGAQFGNSKGPVHCKSSLAGQRDMLLLVRGGLGSSGSQWF